MGFLSGIRVLDLTDERGLLAGRILADLGADVVQAEQRGGSSARSIAPFTGEPIEDGSFYWDAYAANKRGVVYDPSTSSGREFIAALAAAADVVIASGSALQHADLAIDRKVLMTEVPGLVWCSISPFGLDGPKSDYQDTEIVLWAAGGPLAGNRDSDRPPLRISVPQAYLHAAADAAAGILLALASRRSTGRGQHVDVSGQTSLGICSLGQALAALIEAGRDDTDPPPFRIDLSGSGSGSRRTKWEGKDGLIEFNLAVGPGAGQFSNALFKWMRDEGADCGRFGEWDWTTLHDRIESGEIDMSELDEAREVVADFLRTKTKLEAIDAAVTRKVLAAGILDTSDLARSEHFKARGYWVTVGEGDRRRTVPGPFASIDAPAFEFRRPAPLLGEHTDEVRAEWLPRATNAAPATAVGTRLPLEGLKVLDLSWVVAGPVIGRALADFGATVVRVESSKRVETARNMPPFVKGVMNQQASGLYETCNAGKLGICIDLNEPEGADVVGDLARWADVVIESFSPGTVKKWGLDEETLRRKNPRLIYVSTSLCGQSGPWSAMAGYGNVGAALAGFQNLVGWPDRLPLGPYGPYTDYVGPRFSLVAILAALEWRNQSGRGCYIDVSQVEAGIQFLGPEMAEYFGTGRIAERSGNRDRQFSPHGVYPCKQRSDGTEAWIALAVRNDDDWAILSDAMGRPDLASSPLYSSAQGRLSCQDELDKLVGEWTSNQHAHELETSLQQAGVPSHVAATSADFCADPQIGHRQHIVRLDHPLHGHVFVEGPRYVLSTTPGGPARHAPTLNEDTEFVLRTILHYDESKIQKLWDASILA